LQVNEKGAAVAVAVTVDVVVLVVVVVVWETSVWVEVIAGSVRVFVVPSVAVTVLERPVRLLNVFLNILRVQLHCFDISHIRSYCGGNPASESRRHHNCRRRRLPDTSALESVSIFTLYARRFAIRNVIY
jgi:hypothetical protein